MRSGFEGLQIITCGIRDVSLFQLSLKRIQQKVSVIFQDSKCIHSRFRSIKSQNANVLYRKKNVDQDDM